MEKRRISKFTYQQAFYKKYESGCNALNSTCKLNAIEVTKILDKKEIQTH